MQVKIYFYSAKNLLAASFFSLNCCASGQTLIHKGVQGRFDKKKRSKEKSSQQKTPPRTAGRCLVLWQAPHFLR
jgi:hypothetical protein